MKKIGLVFVHGFTGGSRTWKNGEGVSFAELLKSDPKLSENYEFMEFEYYTKLLDFFDSAPIQRLLGILRIPKLLRYKAKVRSNKPISKLSDFLQTSLRVELPDCDEVIIIAHSMGGLIAKDMILNYVEGIGPKPMGFISVAVPHKGSLGALLLSVLNINAKELQPLNEYSDSLNSEWVAQREKLPESIYLVALQDECVPKVSAIPYKIDKCQEFTFNKDHVSISKPESTSDQVYKVVSKFLTEFAYRKHMGELSKVSYLSSPPSYEKEIFVIKMILCDIGEKGIDDAKECFFHAEIISKAANRNDKTLLIELQKKVLSIYRQTYNEYVKKSVSSNEVFSKVLDAILKEDSLALKAGVNYINFLHKKGLLHQLANKLCKTVVWSEETDLAEVLKKTS